jgi:23S rRNA pseudouridine1911/1915/1917 synthase
LDRDTSGVILVAKNDAIHHALSRQFEKRTVRKVYTAICRGAMDRDRDEIDQPIGAHPYQREKMAIRSHHPTVRQASTYFEVERRWEGFLLLRVLPRTGRTHQIRVHLAHVGCPIVCDPLYAGHARLTLGELTRGPLSDASHSTVILDRLALHARSIEFAHPATGERLEVEAPLPDDLRRLIETLDRLRSPPPAPRHRSADG